MRFTILKIEGTYFHATVFRSDLGLTGEFDDELLVEGEFKIVWDGDIPMVSVLNITLDDASILDNIDTNYIYELEDGILERIDPYEMPFYERRQYKF